jgi:hypothetical protein
MPTDTKQPGTPAVRCDELLAAVAEEREWLEHDHKKYQDAHGGEKCIDHTICIQTCDLLSRILKRAANVKADARRVEQPKEKQNAK